MRFCALRGSTAANPSSVRSARNDSRCNGRKSAPRDVFAQEYSSDHFAFTLSSLIEIDFMSALLKGALVHPVIFRRLATGRTYGAYRC